MVIGVIVSLVKNIDAEMKKAADMGFHSCQLVCWDMDMYTQEMAEEVKKAMAKYDMQVSAVWAGWNGPRVWNFTDGPVTLGLLPVEYRWERINNLKAGADFATWIGVKQIITHAGFIPENPHEQGYAGMIAALRDVAAYCKKLGIKFLFETGQETPVTLKRAIEAIGLDNIGVNLDPANLMLYGKANPVDALDTIGEYVCDVHAKDGDYPKNGMELGEEYAIGKGRANFPALIKKLKELGYDGPLTIEREIEGDEQIKDIKDAKAFLETLI